MLIRFYIPTHNRCNLACAQVARIREYMMRACIHGQRVLVDDGCTDGTYERCREIDSDIERILLDGKSYWGGALNAIIEDSRQVLGYDYIGILNDDIVVSYSSFTKGIEFIRQGLSVVAAKPVNTVRGDGSEELIVSDSVINRYIEKKNTWQSVKGPGLGNVGPTAFILIERSAIVGLRPISRFVPHYLSDYYLTLSLAEKGVYTYMHDDFFVVRDKRMTRNAVRKQEGPRTTDELRRKVYSRLDIRSPEYIFAHLVVRYRFSKERWKIVKIVLSLLRFLFMIAVVEGKIATRKIRQ